MNGLCLPCPSAPGFALDFDALDAEFAWVRALRGCPQDPVWHAEGDVWIHTRMVCEWLAASAEWRALPLAEREISFAAALLHDVAKPECTREEAGRITSRGHSVRGEITARRLLWERGADLLMREEVARIVEVHQAPFFAVDRPDAARLVHRISQFARPSLVALVAEADARGRTARDRQRLLDNVALFRELAAEQECLDGPRSFSSDHARVEYFRTPGRDASYATHDDAWPLVTLLSGLPGTGKDTWLREREPGLPVVHLDALRAELDVDPDDPQGPVVAAAKERAREFLRRRQPFAWNATNVSRSVRGQLLDLFYAYGARVRIVYLEVPFEEQRVRNRGRADSVPEKAMQRMLARWQVPDRAEAHEVFWNEVSR
jgi:predicted kinase